jgi:hypothetical protein
MHYYDCPCDECRQASDSALYERLITLIERLEQELERPPVKEYERALQWLAGVCGSYDAVMALGTGPLRGEVPLPAEPRVAEVATLLRTLAADLFSPEMEVAFLRGLVLVWTLDPGAVLSPASASYVAAGVAWAIGEANGVVGSTGVTSPAIKRALGTPGGAAMYARPIRRALIGLWEWGDGGSRLAAYGDPSILTSSTRRALIRMRDRALAARELDREAA